jgi:propionate CoA-transferase
MRNKIVTAADAMALVQDGDTIATSGFVGIGVPDDLLAALQARYATEAMPRDLTLLFAAGQGDGKERGLNRLAADGLLRRVVGGHWGLVPKVGRLALEDRIEGYNLPQGVISQMYRDIAAGKPGTITRVGLRTFVDPRLEGGKVNAVSTDDLVQLIKIGGDEILFYRALTINVALLRATTADPDGNLTMEREALTLDNLAMAMAARNCGGIVIAQVERTAAAGSLHPRQVVVPGILVDCVVVADAANHAQTYRTQYSPAFSAELRIPLESALPLALDERKVIARRAAMELPVNGVVNLGIGMPEGVASVANEERILDLITLTAEPGVIGGMPASGLDFGAAVNTDAIIHQNQQFDFYDGGGLDLACLGMAEAGAAGDVNVSRFGSRLAGAGGFINISQNARRVVFMGTFTAGGLDVVVEDGRLQIRQEGRSRKFRQSVQQVTFSGPFAAERGQEVLYVTERCVFRLNAEGLELVEVAPGVDIERDVLGQMGFRPLVRTPKLMDDRIFRTGPMDLRASLLDLHLPDRIAYDADRNLLFLNFERMHVRDLEDVQSIRAAVEERCGAIGRRVGVVVNYDGFRLDEGVADAYASMVREVADAHYSKVSRYTTSAFLRHKLSNVLTRVVAPHIFETPAEARAFHELVEERE